MILGVVVMRNEFLVNKMENEYIYIIYIYIHLMKIGRIDWT